MKESDVDKNERSLIYTGDGHSLPSHKSFNNSCPNHSRTEYIHVVTRRDHYDLTYFFDQN